MQSMKVVHIIASVNANVGGPSQSVAQLGRHLAECGNAVRLMSLDYKGLGSLPSIGNAVLDITPAQFLAVHFRGYSRKFALRICAAAQDCDVVHNHGLWMWPNFFARRAATHTDRPLVVSPRGMLEPWAMKRGRFKKSLFWRLFEQENLAHASMFHATSHDEAVSIRDLRFKQPIALIPNAVELPELTTIADRRILEAIHCELRGKRWLLFLSRLHAKKGIRELLSVWREIHSDFPAWQLIVAGNLDVEFGPAILKQIRQQSLDKSVTVVGHLDGQQKAAALRHAELFVLPSYSENFGIAIAEALAHATPVITTTATPWRELPGAGAGWCIEPGEESLRQTLPSAMRLSGAQLAEMGSAGRKLMATRHDWTKVAREMARSYEWLLNTDKVAKPDFILTNGVSK
jgi:glycosyltransferase involved in cell wall biosynthesis